MSTVIDHPRYRFDGPTHTGRLLAPAVPSHHPGSPPAPKYPLRPWHTENPMPLSKIAWGRRDPALARAVMHNIERTMPPVVIPWQRNFHKVAAMLHSHGFVQAKVCELIDLAAPRATAKRSRRK